MEFTQGMGAGGKMGKAHKPSTPAVLLLLKALLLAKLLWRTRSWACLNYSNLGGSPQAGQSWDSAPSSGTVLPAQAAPALRELGKLSSEAGMVPGPSISAELCIRGVSLGYLCFGQEFLCPRITLCGPTCLCLGVEKE